jgi:Endosomal/lysosomal potassium channel TMEM175
MAEKRGIYNLIAGKSLERIAALSDGLFAIAMTLIVLDIRVPPGASIHSEADLGRALLALFRRIVMYLVSFLTLGIFWVGQQTQLPRGSRGLDPHGLPRLRRHHALLDHLPRRVRRLSPSPKTGLLLR